MINTDINNNYFKSSSDIKKAEELFLPLDSTKLSKFQILQSFFHDIIFFIPKYFQKRRFIEDFTKQVSHLEKIQTSAETNSLQTIDICAKKMKQLNVFHAVHSLITKKARYTLPVKLELSIKLQIIELQKCLNKAINAIEGQKILDAWIDLEEIRAEDTAVSLSEGNQIEDTELSEEGMDSDEESIVSKNDADDIASQEQSALNDSLMFYNTYLYLKIASQKQSAINESINYDGLIEIFDEHPEQEINYGGLTAIFEPIEQPISYSSHLTESSSSIHDDVEKDVLEKVYRQRRIKDIGTEVEDLKNGNYGDRLCQLATTSLRMITLATLTALVIPAIAGKLNNLNASNQLSSGNFFPSNGLDIPSVGGSQIHSEIVNHSVFAPGYFAKDPAPYWNTIVAAQNQLHKTLATLTTHVVQGLAGEPSDLNISSQMDRQGNVPLDRRSLEDEIEDTLNWGDVKRTKNESPKILFVCKMTNKDRDKRAARIHYAAEQCKMNNSTESKAM